jgi:hypothetical protein
MRAFVGGDELTTIKDQIVAGDKAATRWSAEGTKTAPSGRCHRRDTICKSAGWF